MRNIWGRFRNTFFGDVIYPQLIYHGKLKKYEKFLINSQYWNEKKIENFQFLKIKNLIKHCYQNVPYYNKLLNRIDILPDDIKNLEDFTQIPFLTKQIVRKNLNELKANNYPENKFSCITTGGSTGEPLSLFVNKDVWFVEDLAFQKVVLKRFNVKLKGRFLYLRESITNSHNKNKYWKYVIFRKGLILSSYHMSISNLYKYVEKINRFRPRYIIAYPSSLSLLCSFIFKNKFKINTKIDFIIVGGEKLYNWQRYIIKRVFKCKIIQFYGNAERTAFAANCEFSDNYHFYPEYSYVEFINLKGKKANKNGEKCEIVGTSFCNDIFPLIRYRTGDFGAYDKENCGCGRKNLILKNIDGRMQEYVISNKNNLIPLIGLYSTIAKSTSNVIDFQFFQNKIGVLILKIVKNINYSKLDENIIKDNILIKIGSGIKLNIVYVDKILRSKRGKHQFLIQNIKIDNQTILEK